MDRQNIILKHWDLLLLAVDGLDAPGPTVVEMNRASSAASTSWADRQETSRGLSRFPLTVAHIS
jgi:hypothetical protein